MAYSDILKMKKNVSEQGKLECLDFLVVGGDYFAVKAFHKLSAQYGAGRVSLLLEQPIDQKRFLGLGPSVVRGSANCAALMERWPQYVKDHKLHKSLFYKESKFRKFSGRHKSAKLLWGEEFYTQDFLKVDVDAILSEFSTESWEAVHSRSIYGMISKITLSDEGPELVCTNGNHYRCKKIYWGNGLWNFLSSFGPKNKLTDEFIEFCEEMKTPCNLNVTFFFDGKVSESGDTIFLPLSQTYDWGHFVGEFKTDENGTQRGEFINFIDPDSTSEEDISKKIRLLKRNLEKIYPGMKSKICNEYITLTNESTCPAVADERWALPSFLEGKFVFISDSAPLNCKVALEDDFNLVDFSCSHLVRGLLAHDINISY